MYVDLKPDSEKSPNNLAKDGHLDSYGIHHLLKIHWYMNIIYNFIDFFLIKQIG